MLRSHSGGEAVVAVEGDTIGEVVASLVQRFPGLAGQIVTPDGTLHKFVNLYVNEDDVRYLDGLGTKVAPDDVISILPAVAGGAVAGGAGVGGAVAALAVAAEAAARPAVARPAVARPAVARPAAS